MKISAENILALLVDPQPDPKTTPASRSAEYAHIGGLRDGSVLHNGRRQIVGPSPADTLIAAACKRRQDKAEEKYGQRLLTHSGRDARVDLMQELLDALNYSEQMRYESLAPGAQGYERSARIQGLIEEVAILVLQEIVVARYGPEGVFDDNELREIATEVLTHRGARTTSTDSPT